MTSYSLNRPEQRAALTGDLLDVVNTLWFEIDHSGGSAASGFFTPNATLTFDQRTFTGTAEIDEVYTTRAARGPRVSRHLATNLVVVRADATTATAVSIMLLFAQDGTAPQMLTSPTAVGDVVDDFVLSDGRWLIRSRVIRMLFLASHNALAVPTQKLKSSPEPAPKDNTP